MNIDLLPLIALREGEEGLIHFISGGYGLISRLASMGIAPGTQVTVLRNSGGPLLLLTNGTRIAIGKGQSSKIMVCKLKIKKETKPNEGKK
ncbi:MAG: ferrous iron transport protein A [Nitrospirae bacterium]|jgi:Fe2+ transport system protein FeoA|nr:ferrous iron transport protein A [Nitrospirota bacterium]